MKILLLFSAWAPDDRENSKRWLYWYKEVVDSQFHEEEKFISVNYGSHACVYETFKTSHNLLEIETVTSKLHVNSDAAGFQLSLGRCRKIISKYDYVLFLHTKGISYSFLSYALLAPALKAALLDKSTVFGQGPVHPSSIICYRGHMVSELNSIVECEKFARGLNIKTSVFNWAAGMTLYYAPAAHLMSVIERPPEDFWTKNLLSLGQNRFFFEGVLPSLLVMTGARPVFVEGIEFDPKLNNQISYDNRPKHCSAIVISEFGRREAQGDQYNQHPIPYIFCDHDDTYKSKISFAI
jgi:hypothetical protein